jgi:hypothetical protein
MGRRNFGICFQRFINVAVEDYSTLELPDGLAD